MAIGLPTEQLRGRIGSYLDEVQRLLLETNNFDAIQDDLAFAATASVVIQQFDATPENIQMLVDQLEDDGAIAHGIATSLLQKLSNAHDRLASGDFEAALGLVTAFVNEVRAQSGKHIDADAAEGLVAYASYVGGLLDSQPALEVEQVAINGRAGQRSNVQTLAFQFSRDTNLQGLIDTGEITEVVRFVAPTDGAAAPAGG